MTLAKRETKIGANPPPTKKRLMVRTKKIVAPNFLSIYIHDHTRTTIPRMMDESYYTSNSGSM